jgi:K+-sensing histidine kinase KdpD
MAPSEIVESLLQTFSYNIRAKEIQLNTSGNDTIVRCDPLLVKMALFYIVDNAIKFSREG